MMATGKKVFAVITVVDGKPVVDLGNTRDYITVETQDGTVCIVERKSQEYFPVE